eukprot:6365371-Amphidinium_carterae.1
MRGSEQGEQCSTSPPSPTPASADFWVEIAKDAEGLSGLMIETTHDRVLVAKQPEGPAHLWNENNPNFAEIRLGD